MYTRAVERWKNSQQPEPELPKFAVKSFQTFYRSLRFWRTESTQCRLPPCRDSYTNMNCQHFYPILSMTFPATLRFKLKFLTPHQAVFLLFALLCNMSCFVLEQLRIVPFKPTTPRTAGRRHQMHTSNHNSSLTSFFETFIFHLHSAKSVVNNYNSFSPSTFLQTTSIESCKKPPPFYLSCSKPHPSLSCNRHEFGR